MRIRSRRVLRSSPVRSYAYHFERLQAGYPLFTADNYTIDGGTAKVASFVDLNDGTHALIADAEAKQVATPIAHSDFGAQLCATFGGGAVSYQSNRASSFWNFLHNGTPGHDAVHVMTPTGAGGVVTNVLIGTVAGNASATNNGLGVSWYPNTGTSRAAYFCYRTNATKTFERILQATSDNWLPVNTPTWVRHRYQEGLATEYLLQSKAKVAESGVSTAAPAVGSPQYSFILGNDSTGLNGANMRWRMSAFFPRSLSDAEFSSYVLPMIAALTNGAV